MPVSGDSEQFFRVNDTAGTHNLPVCFVPPCPLSLSFSLPAVFLQLFPSSLPAGVFFATTGGSHAAHPAVSRPILGTVALFAPPCLWFQAALAVFWPHWVYIIQRLSSSKQRQK